VVISAVGKPAIALKAWNKLIQIWDVEEFDSISLRFLPAIYVNIGFLDGNLNPKLLGKYRYNSVRNLQRLRSLKPIIAKFHDLSIDYRLVKGFAISLRMKTLGYRIMGDIDLVIRRDDLKNVLCILSDSGFIDKFFVDCEKYTVSEKQEKYTLISDSDIEIDGLSLKTTLAALQERMAIMVPNLALEKEFAELKACGDKYRELEREFQEQLRMWNTLKHTDK
jgi:hypothetical protein